MKDRISINWQKSSVLAQKEVGEARYFPKVNQSSKACLSDVATEISRRTTCSRADVVGVLSALTEVMSDSIREGSVVRLDGLGSFKVRLTTDEPVTALNHRSHEHVRVKGVQFIPDSLFVNELRDVSFTQHYPTVYTDKYDESRFRTIVSDYLHTHPFINRRIFESLTKVSSTKAKRLLSAMAKDGFLVRYGTTHPIYTLQNDSQK